MENPKEMKPGAMLQQAADMIQSGHTAEDQDIIDKILAHLRDKELAAPTLPLLAPPPRGPPEVLSLIAGKEPTSTSFNQQGRH
jgi:hypothetical protein